MATGNAIRAGRAFVELFADDTQLNKALAGVQAKLASFAAGLRAVGAGLAALGGASVASLVGTSKVFATMGDQLEKMSQRTGVSVESLSELGYAADQSGASLETLESGIQSMNRVIVSAGLGVKKAKVALDMLGLSFDDLKGLDPETQFMEIATRIAEIQNPTLRAATAMRIFGDAGTQLLPMFKEGEAGIEKLRSRAQKLGLTISGPSAHAAVVFGDAMDELHASLRKVAFSIGEAVAPTLQKVAEWLTENVAIASRWIQSNKGVVVMALQTAVAVTAAGGALIALSAAFSVASKAVGVVVGGLSLLHGVLSAGMTAVIALTNPIILLGAAVVALGGYITYMAIGGAKGLRELGSAFTGLKGTAESAVKGITDALSDGNIELAGKVLFSSLRIVWQEGIIALNEITSGLSLYWNSVVTDMAIAFVKGIATMQTAWSSFHNLIEHKAGDFGSFMLKADIQRKVLLGKLGLPGGITEKQANFSFKVADQAKQAYSDQIDNAMFDETNKIARTLKEQIENANGDLDAITNKAGENLAKLREELKALRLQLKNQVDEAAKGPFPNSFVMPDSHVGKVTLNDINNAASHAAEVLRTIQSRGTFNPFEASRTFGGAGPSDRLVAAAEETAKNTKRTADGVDNLDGLTFDD